MSLDIDFVHAQFPQYSDEHTRVQPYYPFAPSADAGEAPWLEDDGVGVTICLPSGHNELYLAYTCH